MKNTQPRANGATWHVQDRKCYAEFGMSGQDKSKDTRRTCAFKPHGRPYEACASNPQDVIVLMGEIILL